MRVVIVTNIFPPAIGGPATFGQRLADALANEGHKVVVVCCTKHAGSGQGKKYQVVTVGTSGNILSREIKTRLAILRHVASTHVVYCMGLEHQTQWACQLMRKPFVLRIGGDSVWEAARYSGMTARDPEGFYQSKDSWQDTDLALPYSRRIRQISTASAVVYVSQYMKRLSRLWGAQKPVRETVILNGIDVSNTKTKNVLESVPDREPLKLLFVGRQTNWKGVDAILLAMKVVDSVKLTVVGSGNELPANIDLARRLALGDRVAYLGRIGHTEVDRLMKEHDVLILPSLYEGLSNTLLEAGAAGMCCIASNRGGNDEVLIHEQSGILVDPFDISQMAGAIRELAENSGLRYRFGEAHKRHVSANFRLDVAVTQTFELLRTVAGGRC